MTTAKKSGTKKTEEEGVPVPDTLSRIAENERMLAEERNKQAGTTRRQRIFEEKPVYGNVRRVDLDAEEPQAGVIAQGMDKASRERRRQ